MNANTATTPATAQDAVPAGLLRHLQDGKAVRSLQFERSTIDEEARTVVLAFASETPVERWWGIEILDCNASAMRQGRLRAGANLLCDHNQRDVVGVIESVEIGTDKVARAVVRFGKSARAEEVWQDVKDGIRRNVSVGYLIHRAVLAEERDGLETYRVTDWEPYEISLVSVPADASVGVGRSLATSAQATPAATSTTPSPTEENRAMTTEATTAAAPAAAPAQPAQADQRNHAVEIAALGKTVAGGAELAMSAIQRGLTVEQFQRELIDHMASKPKPTADIGMTDKEVRSFSIVRALHALANPGNAAARNAAAFEFEASAAAAKAMNREAQGVMVPYDVMRASDLIKATASKGGNVVATELLSGSFIDLLRNSMVLGKLGVVNLAGLVGDIAIPKQTGAATAYWVAEDGSPNNSGQTLGQVAMSPKTLGAYTDISRKLLLQSSIDVESMVQRDLATVLGLAIQQAAINGTGASNQPKGILGGHIANPTIIGGTNGAAPTWEHIVGLETAVSVANADVGTLGYLTNAKVRGKLKTTSKVSGQNGFIWENGDTPLNGYGCAVTNAVPSNITKGTATNCSAAIFGNWADLVIGMWGSLDLTVDTVTLGTSGAVRVIALQDVDIAVRNAESFATFADILTA
ncbi:phage major capsid protein [Comamonas kerstersii]|uniref:phage major capsid protein n=1 Tax=Comamonas kerstersii TaxID=225992 RepID=UPI001B31D8F4|nr:phage major capsid protein [Comamonas kerstersii]QTW18189.1 phage major capsid protein [Comamonas kerstersii]